MRFIWNWKVKSHSILKKNIFLFVFTASFLLVASIFFGQYSFIQVDQTSIVSSSFSDRTPAFFMGNPYDGSIPTGTQMIIPPWIMEQYLLSEQSALYSTPLNYLIYNYGVSAPSNSEESEDTYYIPLTTYKNKYDFDTDYDDSNDDRDDRSDDDPYGDTVMVDITNLTLNQLDESEIAIPPSDVTPSAGAVPPSRVVPPSDVTPSTGTVSPSRVEPPSDVTPSTGAVSPSRVEPPSDVTPSTGAVSPSRVEPPSDVTPSTGTIENTSPRTTIDMGPIFINKKPIDVNRAPPVPDTPLESDPSITYPVSCEQLDNDLSNTEARLPCVDCLLNVGGGSTDKFLSEIDNTVKRFNKHKKFSAVIKKFCDSCGVNIGDFLNYLERRSKEKNVPPEIMFAIMLRESNGDCNAGGDGQKSFGLFQLNTTNSTCLKQCSRPLSNSVSANEMKSACDNGNYRNTYRRGSSNKCTTPSSNSKICLNNPYCNFEESLHLLTGEKWAVGNGRKPKPQGSKKWVEMNNEERTLWRNAIIAYNGGAALKVAEKKMKEGLQMGEEPFLDNWEIKRMFFMKCYLLGTSSQQAQSRMERVCKNLGSKSVIHNLAYVESIAGRDKPGAMADSSVCKWIRFRKDNQRLSCQ